MPRLPEEDEMSRELHDGACDGLTPLVPLDVEKATSTADLVRRMQRTAFGGRNLGEALEVTKAMIQDPDCFVVMTLSGAMTMAKMGLVICSMLKRKWVDAVVSTGALITHGLSEGVGATHYQYNPSMNDEELFEKGYNRVYDTLEMEMNLQKDEEVVHAMLRGLDWSEPTSSHELCAALGKKLHDEGHMPSILGHAHRAGVPVYIPAFTDSEMGLDVSSFVLGPAIRANRQKPLAELLTQVPSFNPFRDLHDLTRRVSQAKKVGIFTIGGGVPRNWAQQIACFVEILNDRYGQEWPVPRIQYAVRICPEPVHWGGLSGCTYSEGVSWGKFVPPAEGGKFAEVYADATLAWPILVRALIEELG